MRYLVILLVVIGIVGFIFYYGKGEASSKINHELRKVGIDTSKLQKKLQKTVGSITKAKPIKPQMLKNSSPVLKGWHKSGVTVEKGPSFSKADVTYTKGNSKIYLKIISAEDLKTLGIAELMEFQGKIESESKNGYEKSSKEDEFFKYEKWNKKEKSGKLMKVHKNNLLISAKGLNIESMEILKKLISEVKLSLH